ncbi:MAG: type II secretion system protein [Phycisphaerales bacterium]|jgi:prepilin-type N-terminal cleavage/methylation domain-containing protein|nr:type II secretion system protein [Phycisphaerales bacterium]
MLARRRTSQRPAFTLVEILIVIALIGVLAGILLVAVGGATDAAKRARTKSTMESLSAAIDAFVLEHGELPGIVPVHVLHHEHESEGAYITSTQNILLALLGGARVSVADDAGEPLDATAEAEYQRYLAEAVASDDGAWYEFTIEDEHHPLQFNVIVRPRQIGRGPWVNGKQYPPYLSPKDHELLERWSGDYQSDTPDGPANLGVTEGYTALPDLIDAWGQPILVFRHDRSTGPILPPDEDALPQFWPNGIDRYLGATRLGRMGERQLTKVGDDTQGSRIGLNSADENERNYWLYLLLSHPSMRWDYGDADAPVYSGTARAGYAMLSAGPDGIFLGRHDGPIDESDGAPIDPSDYPAGSGDIAEGKDHERLDEFDDVIMYGGS